MANRNIYLNPNSRTEETVVVWNESEGVMEAFSGAKNFGEIYIRLPKQDFMDVFVRAGEFVAAGAEDIAALLDVVDVKVKFESWEFAELLEKADKATTRRRALQEVFDKKIVADAKAWIDQLIEEHEYIADRAAAHTKAENTDGQIEQLRLIIGEIMKTNQIPLPHIATNLTDWMDRVAAIFRISLIKH